MKTTLKSKAARVPLSASALPDQSRIAEVYSQLREAEGKLMGPNGAMESLPNNVYSFLLRLLAELSAGQAVTILQNQHELTTIEASKILGMSRQFFVQLTERGEIPYHWVGSHRRIYARDVLAYKSKRDVARRKILDDLARAEFAAGTYDKVPDDFQTGN